MKLCCLYLLVLPLMAMPPVDDPPAENGDPSEIAETLLITATKKERKLEDLPVSATVVDSAKIEEKGAIAAGEELLGVPGVFIRRQEAGSSFMDINIRGLTGVHGNDTFLALLDGIPFVTAHEEVLLAEVPFGAVEKTEIIRGPVSALYGRGALSGAINYLTKSPLSEEAFSLDLVGGSFGYAKPHFNASIPIGEGTHHLLVDAYAERSDGWRSHTAGESANILLKDEIFLSSKARMSVYLNYHRNEQEPGGVLPLGSDGQVLEVAGGRRGFIGDEPVGYDRQSLMTALKFQYELRDDMSLETTFHYRKVEDNNHLNFFDPFGFDPENGILRVNGFENDRSTDNFFFEPKLTWQLGSHQIIAGINLEQVDLKEFNWWTGQNGFDDTTFDFYFYEINIDYTTGEVLNRDHPFWVTRNEVYRGVSTNRFRAVYFQDEWQMSEKMTLTLGARYDDFERDATIDSDVDFDGVIDENPEISDSANRLSPKVALHHRFSPELQVYAAYGQGFNSNFGAVWQWDPSLYQRGTDVPPSVVKNVEIGTRGRVQNRVSYSATLFDLNQTDRLVFVSDPDSFGPPRATTADEFQSRGLELELNVSPFRNWLGHIAYTYTDAEWKSYLVDGQDFSGKRPLGVPETMLSIGVRGKILDDLEMWTTFHHFDDYAITLDNSVEGGGHDLVDAGLKLRIPQLKAHLTLVGKNVLNEKYFALFGSSSPQTAHPGLPSRFLLTLGIDF